MKVYYISTYDRTLIRKDLQRIRVFSVRDKLHLVWVVPFLATVALVVSTLGGVQGLAARVRLRRKGPAEALQ